MKKYPEIIEQVRGDIEDGVVNEKFTAADAAINSRVLQRICHLVEAKYDRKAGEFASGKHWRIRLEDQHDDREMEPDPHYVLDVCEDGAFKGERLTESMAIDKVVVAYCDNHSMVKEPDDLLASPTTIIDQAPGRFIVYALGDFGGYTPLQVAKIVAGAYVEAMEKVLPDYYIIVDEDAMKI